MEDVDLITCFTIAILGVTLAFTRPLFFHLFRTKGHLYGSSRGDVSRFAILFGAISLSTAVVWLFLVLCSRLPILHAYMRLWFILTIWGCLSICILGIACVISWRVKEWLATRGLPLKVFPAIALAAALIGAVALSQTNTLGHPLVLLLVCGYLASGILVRAFNPLSVEPSAKDPRPIEPQCQSIRRVLVLVFDELDQRLLLDDRHPGLDLPAIDAFMSRALILNNAIPPCRCTEISIPALLTGRMVFETISVGPKELELQFSVDGRPTPLAAQRTLFHEAFDLGYRVGCNIGYHPLDRIFPGLFATFAWQEAPDTELGIEGGWMKSIWLQVRSILETPSFSPFSDTLYARHSVARYQRSVVSAISILGDETIDLAFLHLPVPHPPFIFDRKTNKVTARNAWKRSYHDNLALVDSTLATLLRTIRASSNNRESVVILTSDHWWRHSGDKNIRVPFAVWFSATESSIKHYTARKNTVFMKNFVLQLLVGKLLSGQNIVDWLDSHAPDYAPTKT